MIVRLRYNSLNKKYQFDQHQYMEKNHFIDDFDSIFHAPDMSMRAVFPKVYQAEMPAYFNYRTNIYLNATDTLYFSNTTAGNRTELEKLVIGPNEILERQSFINSRLRENPDKIKNVRVMDKTYAKYINFLLYYQDMPDCPPPYDTYSTNMELGNCFDIEKFYNEFKYEFDINNKTGEVNQTAYLWALPEMFRCYTGVLPQVCPFLKNKVFVNYTYPWDVKPL
jgi:hypothetical protein